MLIKNSPLFDIKCFIFKNAEVVVLEMIMSNEEAKEALKTIWLGYITCYH